MHFAGIVWINKLHYLMKEFASLTIVAMKIGKTVFHLSQQWLLREENSSSET